jgi:predicted acetyltransferase
MTRAFRSATEADLDRVASLAAKSYPGFSPDEAVVRERLPDNPWGGIDDLWLGAEAGEPHAVQGYLYAYQLHLWGRTWPAGGLGSVAVSPDARRRGWGRDLVTHAEAICRKRGWPWMILYPFRVDFYASLGWAVAEVRDTYRVETRDVPLSSDTCHVRLGTVAELDRLAPVYRAFASARHGLLDRETDRWMKMLLRRAPQVAIFERDGEIEGYLLYRYRADAAHPLVQDLVVDELVWTSDRAWRGLWGFVRNQADQTAHVTYNAKRDDVFVHYVSNPSPPGGEILGGGMHRVSRRVVGIMAKILDPLRVAEGRPYGASPGVLDVTLTDPMSETVRFALEIADGKGRVVNDRTAPTLETDIATWSAVHTGSLTLHEASRLGRTGGTADPAEWSAALATPTWSFLDAF